MQKKFIGEGLNGKCYELKTGEILKASDLSAILDIEKLKQDYDLLGYYTLATSEVNMSDQEIIDTYGNLVEIEEQFHIMKSTWSARCFFPAEGPYEQPGTML